MSAPEILTLHPEVRAAIAAAKPVIALESTIISHGMPYPRNVETALEVERRARAMGAVPATIGIIGGTPTVGLSADQIDHLGRAGHGVVKVSRRDIPFVVARRLDGATTVAATMIFAHMAGIEIFATGGIGGVHRGAQQTFDISADLQELARTPVAVICAGAKSILDLGLTLEYLETMGVPVVGYRTDELPAFYTRRSGFGVDYRVDTPAELARAIAMQRRLRLNGGMVIANPVPEQFQMEWEPITAAIDQALIDLEREGISGKASTPFLLARVAELTGGESLESNIQLVYNNVELAAQTAVEYAFIAAAADRAAPDDHH